MATLVLHHHFDFHVSEVAWPVAVRTAFMSLMIATGTVINSNSASFFMLMYEWMKIQNSFLQKIRCGWDFFFFIYTVLGVAPCYCPLLFILWLQPFIFIWLYMCLCLVKDLPLLFYTHYLLLVHSPPTGLLWGWGNCVMVCSLSGSGQALGVFSQSRHLLRCAALFNSDVMYCGETHPYERSVQDRVGAGLWSEMVGVGNSEGEACARRKQNEYLMQLRATQVYV